MASSWLLRKAESGQAPTASTPGIRSLKLTHRPAGLILLRPSQPLWPGLAT
jgi:hypothetical protein